MSIPTVTAIIINWNSGGQLAGCLAAFESIRAENFVLQGLIVVDNGSKDGSAQGLVSAIAPVRVIRNEANLGFGAACNLGAKQAHSDYLLILNPDVRLFQETLDSLVAFAEQPEIRGVAGLMSVRLLDENGRVQQQCARFPTPKRLIPQTLGLDRLLPGRFPPHFMLEWPHDSTRQVDQVPGGFSFIRRDLFEQLEGFDERFFMYYEDVDLNLRAARAGRPSWFYAGAEAVHTGGGTTGQIKARRLGYYLDSRIRFVRKHFPAPAAWTVFFTTTFLEIFPRLLAKLASGAPGDIPEVFGGYWRYWGGLRSTLQDPAGGRP